MPGLLAMCPLTRGGGSRGGAGTGRKEQCDWSQAGRGWFYPDHKAANNIMGQAQMQASPGKLLEALSSLYSTPRLHRELFHIINPPPILSLGTVCSLCISLGIKRTDLSKQV